MNDGRIKAALIFFFCMCICVLSCACAKQDAEWTFEKKVARQINDDGWVYTFDYLYMKDGSDDVIPYSFNGINLRYRYNEHYVTTRTVIEDGEPVEVEVPQTLQILGMSDSEAVQKDMAFIDELLESATNEELLGLTQEDLPLEEVDPKLFLDLVNTAL